MKKNHGTTSSGTKRIGDYTWIYETDDDSATLTEVSPKPSGALTIPSELGGQPVTSIGKGAFAGCESLKSIAIPNSVTSFGEGAFCDCESLKSITIPNSVTSIGEDAFYGCASLTSVRVENPSLNLRNTGLPDGVKVTIVGK